MTRTEQPARTDHLPRHGGGLATDFPVLRRRRMMGLLGGTTVAALAAMAVGEPASAALAVIPEETAGPYPGDGSNGVNVLTRSGIVRSDIRRSFGTASGVAKGVPLTIRMRLMSASTGRPVAGHAVYLWQCDRDGGYSLYSSGLTGQNYLRGVQASDRDGWTTFTSIFPGAYAGRWPHIHFEVYRSVTAATSARNTLHTSQLALPGDVCAKVYQTAGYASSKRNLAQSSLTTDNVFRDGWSLEMASVTGDTTRGFVATRTVGI